MLRKSPEHRPTVSYYVHRNLPAIRIYHHYSILTLFITLCKQASDILKNPYLQPYVNQHGPFADVPHPMRSPEKSITSSRSSRRSMSGSQCSSISGTGSDMDSMQSSEINMSGPASSSNNTIDTEGAEPTNNALVNRYSTPNDIKSHKEVASPDLERQDSSKSLHVDQHPKYVSKQPKIIKKILTTLREETSKLRVNNSPLRASRVKLYSPSHRGRSPDDSKNNSEISSSSKSSEVTPHESAKVNSDTVKQIQASPPPKHLVRIQHFLC